MDGTIHRREVKIGAGAVEVPYVIARIDGEMWYPINALHKGVVAPSKPLASKGMFKSALKSAVQQVPHGGIAIAPPMVRRRLYKAGWIKSNVRHIQIANACTVRKALFILGMSEDVMAQIVKDPTGSELVPDDEEEPSENEEHSDGCVAGEDQGFIADAPNATFSNLGCDATDDLQDATVGFDGLKDI